jgi:hypothetical protein
MRPSREGQIARFHTPYPDEDPTQQYVILEIYFDIEQPKTLIKPLHSKLRFPPLNTVFVEDLELVWPDPEEVCHL